jgi:hypothetical protein
MLEKSFDKIFYLVSDLIQNFRVRLGNMRAAIRGIANVVVPPICVRAMLTLARHTIGWSGNKYRT